jgi:hypothetical protein
MPSYKEIQSAWWIIWLLIPLEAFFIYAFLMHLHSPEVAPAPLAVFIGVEIILILVGLSFYSMTTTVDSENITISYGIGLIKKRIRTGRIHSVTVVENPWYYGWGIRLIPGGWLFNIKGLDAVELEFNDSNRVFRIGSGDCERLKMAIEEMKNARPPV